MKKLAIILALAAITSATSAFAAENKFTPIKESPAIWSNVPDSLKSAKWIWSKYPHFFYEITNVYCAARKTFELSELPKKAPMFISADQSYRLYINGKFVCSGPARGYQHSWPFDEIDVAKFLKKGKNVIAVRAYNGGRSTFAYLTEGYAGIIFALELGNGKNIVSDSTAKTRLQSGCDRDTAEISIQMNNQEIIDLRSENPDWINADFDDSSWTRPSGMKFNAMPYYSMESRMIPMLEEFEIKPAAFILKGKGKASTMDIRVFDVAKIFKDEKIPHEEVLENSQTAVALPSKDEVQSFVFDMGKMMVGMPILKIEGAKGGEIVDIITTELVSKNGGDINGSSMLAPANRLVCREGSQTHQFYNVFGTRYITVRVRNNPDSTLKISPSLMWSAYPLADKGKFKTSNAYVNKIWETCKQTQKICALDAYVDTPYREQAQWWGDARVQSWNTFFISGDDRLLRRGIRSIAMQKVPNGLTYGHAPTKAHNCILPDFSLTWILSLYDHYWQTGSVEAFLCHRDTVDSILSYFDGVTDPKTGLVSYDNRYWLFLDWCGIQKNGQPALLNLWLLEALDKITKMCAENGLDDFAEKYGARAKKIRKAVTENLLTKDGLISDGIMPDGKQNPTTGVHAQTLGRMVKIEGMDFEKAKSEILLPFIKRGAQNDIPKDWNKERLKNDPSSFWVVYVFKLLCDEGYNREVYDFIKSKWKDFAEYGTTFEGYSPSSTSHSHAWSAHPAFILPQILGGVKQEAAGWAKVSFNPNFFEDFAEITYPTPRGNIKVVWKKNADGSYSKTIDTPKDIETIK